MYTNHLEPTKPTEPTDCSWSAPYALQVLGNDMEPEFPDRCIIIVDPSGKCANGAYVVIDVEGVRWFRQYRKDEQGRKWLAAVNNLYPDIELNKIKYNIMGVIVQRNIRRQVKHYTAHSI